MEENSFSSPHTTPSSPLWDLHNGTRRDILHKKSPLSMYVFRTTVEGGGEVGSGGKKNLAVRENQEERPVKSFLRHAISSILPFLLNILPSYFIFLHSISLDISGEIKKRPSFQTLKDIEIKWKRGLQIQQQGF